MPFYVYTNNQHSILAGPPLIHCNTKSLSKGEDLRLLGDDHDDSHAK